MSDLAYAMVGDNSPYAGSIGWVDFKGMVIDPNSRVHSMEVKAKDGTVITFDLICTLVSGSRGTFVGCQAPTFQGAAFGNKGYRGHQAIVLYNNATNISGVIRFSFNNIQVRGRIGTQVTNYSVVVADGEATNMGEKIEYITTGLEWNLLINLPPTSGSSTAPRIEGVGTQTVLESGTAGGSVRAPVVETMNPSNVTVNITFNSGKQGFGIGFIVTSVTLMKDIVKRVVTDDQFKISISGAKTSQATTTGNVDGLQTEMAQVFLMDGDSYVINETLANNRVNGLSDYRQKITAVNLAEGGSTPPIGDLPIQNTVMWGDMIQYTIQNRPDMSDIWVEKWAPYQSRNAGEVMTYVIVVGNDGPDNAKNVELVDIINQNMTDCMYFRTGEDIWKAWTGTLAIGTLEAGEKIVYFIQSKIVSDCPLSNLTNIATISTINYDPNLLNNEDSISTEITRSANITISKIADKVKATRGSWLTYVLVVKNLGPSDISNVIVSDTIPAELAQVQYSLDAGVSWAPWSGDYVITKLQNGETVQIWIKGFIQFID